MAAPSISELIAKKNYAKAIEAIKTQLAAGKHNPQLHIQLADVLLLAKKEKEAIQILMRVADEFAHEGFDAKAIAILKKIDKIEPGRRDVQQKLTSLVKEKRAAAAPPPSGGGGGGGFELGMEEIGFEAAAPISAPAPVAAPPRAAPAPPPPPPRAPQKEEREFPSFAAPEQSLNLDLGGSAPALDFGLDARPAAPPPPPPAPVQDFDFGGDADEPEEAVAEADPIILEPADEGAAVEVDAIQVEPDAPEGAAAPAGDLAFDDLFTQELMGAIDDAFGSAGGAAAPEAAPRAAAVRGDFMSSPLFKGFDPEELIAILEGLTLHNFEPGEIILTQGAPGHSLFILSTGTVKAFVKDEYGNYRFARDLEEGSFFGEFAILTGQPRAATVTAATRCELLELDRGTLDAISISHPHVQQVLRQFYEERMKAIGQPAR